MDAPASLCLDCGSEPSGRRCGACGSHRIVRHAELNALSIAHVDCDAFYAAVEKRENPALRDRPVIVGGGRRGVVSTACYIARIRGVHSAMPMFRALERCPDAVVIRPRMSLYAEVSRQIREMMLALTPAVEPLSLDEAFLDLSGTERLHGRPPAQMLAGLLRRIEHEVGVTASVGLSHNKFLAKLASDFDKPRGFSVIGRAETLERLAPLPVSAVWGVGPVFARALERDGLRNLADVRARGEAALAARHGSAGSRLWRLAHGQDSRRVGTDGPIRSISHEITFETDIADPALLDGHLWRLAEKVADRAKARDLAGRVVTLKLKRPDFRLLSRRSTLEDPTQLTARIHARAAALMAREIDRGPFRLIGVGIADLVPAAAADRSFDLLDPQAARQAAAERVSDTIRARFGTDAILKGRALR
ncbi:MAG: DNA polymerase IV [Alphaproteobacteria bacterium]|nr:MAG: DNA polymerase IV [Alphaproteobacteria bacterium]